VEDYKIIFPGRGDLEKGGGLKNDNSRE